MNREAPLTFKFPSLQIEPPHTGKNGAVGVLDQKLNVHGKNQENFQEWVKAFTKEFETFLLQLNQLIGPGGTLKVFRVQSGFNDQSYIEFGVDGKINRTSNGVSIDNV